MGQFSAACMFDLSSAYPPGLVDTVGTLLWNPVPASASVVLCQKGPETVSQAAPLEKSAIMLAGCIAFPILTLIVSSCIPLWFTRKGDGWIPEAC